MPNRGLQGAPLAQRSPTYPTRATLWHDEAVVIVGGALGIDIATAYHYFTAAFQSGAANGDTFEQVFLLAAGSYTFGVDGYATNNRGIIDWYLDGLPLVIGQDWYAASGAVTVKTATVRVPTTGLHTLRGVVNGKNGSSSGFSETLTKYWFR